MKIFEKVGEIKNRVEDLTRKNQDFVDFRKSFYESNEHIKQNII
jgi:hypothetical protein